MSVQVFKVGGVYHYRYQIGKKRVQRSTRETVRRRAEDIAARAYDDARRLWRGEQLVPTLGELADQWMQVHEAIASPAHLKGVELLRRSHLYGMDALPIDQLTTELVEQARLKHLQGRSRASANHWLRYMKLVVNWAVKRGVIPALPWRVAFLKVQKRPRATLSTAMAADWFRALDAYAVRRPGVRVAVRLMFGLGLREMEALTARWEWLDWDRALYTPGKTKGREADPIPVPPWLLDVLRPLRAATGYIVDSHRPGLPAGPGFTRQAMRHANKACGIQGLTPHRLRGSFATLLSEHGVPIQTIQRVMRHKDHKTTMGYLEVNLDMAVKAATTIGEVAALATLTSGVASGNKMAHSTHDNSASTEVQNYG